MGFSCSGRKLIPSYVSPRQPLEAGGDGEAAQTSTARRSRLKHYQGNMAGTSGGHLGADEVEVGTVDKAIVRKQDKTKTKTPRHHIQSMIVLPRAVAPTLGASVLSHKLKRERQNTLRLRLSLISLLIIAR